MTAIAPRWLTPEDAAAYVGRHRDELRRLVKVGKLPPPSYHFGPRSPRYDRLALDALFTGAQPSADLDIAVREAADAVMRRGRARRQATAGGRHGQGIPIPKGSEAPGQV